MDGYAYIADSALHLLRSLESIRLSLQCLSACLCSLDTFTTKVDGKMTRMDAGIVLTKIGIISVSRRNIGLIQQSTSEYLLFEAVDLFWNAFKVLFDGDHGGKSGAGSAVSAIDSARDRTPNVRWNRGGAVGRASCWRGKGVAKDLEFKDMIDVPGIVIIAAGWFPLPVVRRRIREKMLSDGFKNRKDSVARRSSDRDL